MDDDAAPLPAANSQYRWKLPMGAPAERARATAPPAPPAPPAVYRELLSALAPGTTSIVVERASSPLVELAVILFSIALVAMEALISVVTVWLLAAAFQARCAVTDGVFAIVCVPALATLTKITIVVARQARVLDRERAHRYLRLSCIVDYVCATMCVLVLSAISLIGCQQASMIPSMIVSGVFGSLILLNKMLETGKWEFQVAKHHHLLFPSAAPSASGSPAATSSRESSLDGRAQRATAVEV